ncbi:MAG: sigma-70 family RNA polymerase sigma factor [Leptonema sp. (in: Bacteria)]|nr:sigma-70 family RNA polymerase sigma factor [Leptonema sp. (in: bacteria)]
MHNSREGQLRELMKQSLEGNQRAYRLLLEEATKMLSDYFRSRVFKQENQDDLVQETLISIHKAKSTYNTDLPFTNWMYSIAYRRYIDYVRKQSRIDRMEIPGETILPFLANDDEIESDHQLDAEAVLEAIRELPERQREIVRLLKIDGFSIKEAASIMDMTETALKVAAHRAYKKIRQKFDHDQVRPFATGIRL